MTNKRFAPTTPTANLGLLASLAGNWMGKGFNLIARPDFKDKTDLYLQLNQTYETLQFTPIGSPIPNRGFGQNDINLYGLTYLQKISDAGGDGALHIEPGIWVTQPNSTFPEDSVPAPAQLIARMGTIPHGNSLLAQGIAESFTGTPVLKAPGFEYNFSRFPSFNSTPFAVPPSVPPPTPPGILINADGSSDKGTTANLPLPPPPLPQTPAVPFPQYDFSVPIGPIPTGPFNPPFTLNTRTPFGTNPPEPPLPAAINGVAMQAIINDPIRLLQAEVQALLNSGHTFGQCTVLNVATQTPINFLTTTDSGPAGPITTVAVPQFSGGIENIRFLSGETVTPAAVSGAPPPTPQPQENAQTALVYATFWIEEVTHEATGLQFTQLQYAQMVVLDFPIFHLLHQTPPAFVNLGWPHISVATLRRTFG